MIESKTLSTWQDRNFSAGELKNIAAKFYSKCFGQRITRSMVHGLATRNIGSADEGTLGTRATYWSTITGDKTYMELAYYYYQDRLTVDISTSKDNLTEYKQNIHNFTRKYLGISNSHGFRKSVSLSIRQQRLLSYQAKKLGISTNDYIKDAVDEKIERTRLTLANGIVLKLGGVKND